MDGVINVRTATVHKHDPDGPSLATECPATRRTDRKHLRRTPLERTLDDDETSRCGQCFPDGDGS